MRDISIYKCISVRSGTGVQIHTNLYVFLEKVKYDEIYVIYARFRDDGKPFPYCIPCQDPYKGKGWLS